MKQTKQERDKWLKKLRTEYLNFLRNLTPQILIATLAAAFWRTRDFTRASEIQDDVLTTFVAFFLIATFLLAAFCNAANFYDEAFQDFKEWKTNKIKELSLPGRGKFEIGIRFIGELWRKRLLEASLAFITQILFQVIFFIVGFEAALKSLSYPK